MATTIPDVNNDPVALALNETEALYRFLVSSLIDYAVFVVSPTGIVLSWNAGGEQTFGFTEREIVGQPFARFFSAEDVAAGAPAAELASALSGAQAQHDRWHVRKDGTRFWGTNTVQPLYDFSGKLLGFTKLVRDTTVTHAASEALNDSEQQLRLLIESVRDYAFFSIGPDAIVLTWNSGAEMLFGYAADEIIGRPFAELFSAADRAADVPASDVRFAEHEGAAGIERWLSRKDGSIFRASGKIRELQRDAAGGPRGFVIIAHDITEDQAAAQDLARRAHYDELTALPNRRMFYECVVRAIALMKRRDANLFAVLFIDLDHFKAVNDEFGHIVADGLLGITARRLEQCARSEDVVARIGGDEFAILLNGIEGVDDATDAAERIGIEMRKPALIDGRTVGATVSIGIALGTRKYKRPEDVLRDADRAMYAAKTEGRARAFVFTPAMATGNPLVIDLAADLRLAIERGELRAVYQPIVDLRSTRVVGFEALVRWEHPRRGLLAPAEFIFKAEESELVTALDRWMLGEAIHQLAQWTAAGVDPTLRMSVNVSSREFSRDDFLDELRTLISVTHIDPTRLRLEITESSVIERSAGVSALLAAIRAAGVEIAIDDFGTGYSSLGMLQTIAVDALKIDTSFVARIAVEQGRALTDAVITLAHKLGLAAVAEGIETPEQLARLISLGCDFGQGYLFAPPLDANAAERFVRGSMSTHADVC